MRLIVGNPKLLLQYSGPAVGKLILAVLSILYISSAFSADQMAPERHPDDQIEALTMDVLRLQRDWLELKEWPSESPERRIEIYLTTTLPEQMSIYSITLQVNQDDPIRHDYAGDQMQALRDGGAHRVYLGGLAPGRHLLSASVSGWDGLGRNYTANTRLSIRKVGTSKLIELHLLSIEPGTRPDFVVREWD